MSRPSRLATRAPRVWPSANSALLVLDGMGAGLEGPEVPAQRLLGRSGAGRVPHDERGVDPDQAAPLDVRREGGRDLVVGAHRADQDQPGVLVEHREPAGLLLPPGEVDPDVVHGGSLHHQNVARISPTRTPPPSRSTTPVRWTASVSTPGSSSDPAARQRGGHQHRPDPRGAVVGLERERAAVGQRHRVAGLGSRLADRTGDRAQQGGLVPRRAGDELRVGPDRLGHPLGRRVGVAPAVDPQGQPPERRGQAHQRGGEERRAAAVDGHHRRPARR